MTAILDSNHGLKSLVQASMWSSVADDPFV